MKGVEVQGWFWFFYIPLFLGYLLSWLIALRKVRKGWLLIMFTPFWIFSSKAFSRNDQRPRLFGLTLSILLFGFMVLEGVTGSGVSP